MNRMDVGQEGGGGLYTRVRLDRALVTPDWNLVFRKARLRQVHVSCSDHFTLWLQPEVEDRDNRLGWKSKLFRYEITWKTYNDFGTFLAEKWSTGVGSSVGQLSEKLKRLLG